MNRPSVPPARTRRRARAIAAAGYTAVEVLMALTLMAIGASAVMSMQKASVQGNLDARRGDVAYSLALLWVERLRKDAMSWTLPSPANPSQSNFSSTQFLNNVDTKAGHWFLPDALKAATPPISPGFDILGRDLSDPSQAQFCVHVRLTYLFNDTTQNAAGVTASNNNLIRADVRVLWARSIGDPSASVGAGPCDSTVAGLDAPDPRIYQSIYVTSAIRQNGAP